LTRAEFDFRLLDNVAVKGKTQSTRIYELLGRKGESSVGDDLVRDYEAAFAAYARAEFSEAIALLERHAHDGPSQTLLARCREYLADPPPPAWSGVYEPATK
jgi:adenylate cyclase